MSEEIKHNHDQDCDCGCEGHDEELIMLEDEDGNEIAFHYVTTLEHDGKEYVFLQIAEGEDEDVVEIYELETIEEEGEEPHDALYPVEDELYELLFQKLLAEMGEDDECDDEDCDCHHHHDDDDE